MSCGCDNKSEGKVQMTNNKKAIEEKKVGHHHHHHHDDEFSNYCLSAVNCELTFHLSDPCCCIDVCDEKMTVDELLYKTNKNFREACIPSCVLVASSALYKEGGCCKKGRRVGCSVFFFEFRECENNPGSLIGRVWNLLCFPCGQVLLKTKENELTENCFSFELSERCVPFNGNTHTASGFFNVIGSTGEFRDRDGSACLFGTFGYPYIVNGSEEGEEGEEKRENKIEDSSSRREIFNLKKLSERERCHPLFFFSINWNYNLCLRKRCD